MEIFTAIISLISTTVVAIFSYKATKREKANKEYQDLLNTLEAERKKSAEQEKKLHEEEMTKLTKQISSMSDKLSNLSEHIEEIDMNIDKLSSLTKYDLEYSTEINNALIILAQTLASDTIDRSTIQAQLQVHQEKTNAIQNKLYQSSF